MIYSDDSFTLFTFDFSDYLIINRRMDVRYPAQPSTLTLRKKNLLNPGSEFTGQLVNICANGALVCCFERLAANVSLKLIIVFADGTLFKLKGKVIREQSSHHYGIKFDNSNQYLDEYLYTNTALS